MIESNVPTNTKSLKKIILASSSSVYGIQDGKMNESKTNTEPVSPYGVSKLAVEHLAKAYVKNLYQNRIHFLDRQMVSLNYKYSSMQQS